MKSLKALAAVGTGVAVAVRFLLPWMVLRVLVTPNNRRVRSWPGDRPVVVYHGR